MKCNIYYILGGMKKMTAAVMNDTDMNGAFSSAVVGTRERLLVSGSLTCVTFLCVNLSCHCLVDREKMLPRMSVIASLVNS